MRILTGTLLLLLLWSAAPAQEKERWQRVQMYDDISVEVDAANVVFGADFTGRVKFRFSYAASQSLPKKGIKYKRVIQTMDFGCSENRYRIVTVERLDGKGNQVELEQAQPDAEWKPLKGGNLLDNMFKAGCELINEKKKNP